MAASGSANSCEAVAPSEYTAAKVGGLEGAHGRSAPRNVNRSTTSLKNAARAGIRSIEHGIFLDDEAIGLMLDRGTWLVPTLIAPVWVLESIDAGAQISEASIRKARETVGIHAESISRASR